MHKIDETLAHALQAEWVLSHSNEVLGKLYTECRVIAQALLGAYSRRNSLRYSSAEIENKAHDAAAKLIEYYLSRPGYTVTCFTTTLNFRVKEVLFKTDRVYYRVFNAQLDPSMPIEEPEEEIDLSWSFLDLKTEHPQGSRILYVLANSRRYAAAIHKLQEFVEKSWLKDHAQQLHKAYLVMKKGSATNGRRKNKTPVSHEYRRRVIGESARQIKGKRVWKSITDSTDDPTL